MRNQGRARIRSIGRFFRFWPPGAIWGIAYYGAECRISKHCVECTVLHSCQNLEYSWRVLPPERFKIYIYLGLGIVYMSLRIF